MRLRDALAAPVRRRDLHSQTVWIAHGEIVAGVTLHAFDARALDRSPQPFGVEIFNANTEMIDVAGLVAFLQDDQPSARQIKSMIVRSLDASGWEKPNRFR